MSAINARFTDVCRTVYCAAPKKIFARLDLLEIRGLRIDDWGTIRAIASIKINVDV